MWCKNNKCCYYDEEENKCKRVGKKGSNKGRVSICWMNKLEGEY